MKRAYLIFDIGTGNSRAAVVSEDGEILATVRENTAVYTDSDIRNSVVFDPGEWTEAVFRLAGNACRSIPDARICGVCASSQREGIVLLDAEGKAIEGLTNADRRGEPWMDALDWDRIWDLTDLRPTPILSAVKLLGEAHLRPDVLARTRMVTSISDWIGTLFTGRCVWERAQAMQSALYDPVTEEWSDELCGIFGVDPAILPPLADAGDVLGPIDPGLCSRLGMAEDAVFIVGTADTQAALAGADARCGETVVVSGTTSPCLRLIDEFRKYPLTWVSPTASRGMFMLEVNTTSSGINLQRYKDNLMADISYEELNREAEALGLPETGLPPIYAVFLRGMHLDEDNLTGGFLMKNPLDPKLGRNSFFHALTLCIGMSIVRCLERLEELEPGGPDYVIGCGGGFLSPVICRTVADLSGKTLRLYRSFRESTVYGCFLLCSQAVGGKVPSRELLMEYTPRPCDELRAYYAKWLEAREQLKPLKL